MAARGDASCRPRAALRLAPSAADPRPLRPLLPSPPPVPCAPAPSAEETLAADHERPYALRLYALCCGLAPPAPSTPITTTLRRRRRSYGRTLRRRWSGVPCALRSPPSSPLLTAAKSARKGSFSSGGVRTRARGSSRRRRWPCGSPDH